MSYTEGEVSLYRFSYYLFGSLSFTYTPKMDGYLGLVPPSK